MTDYRSLYPEIEPYESGMLDVGEGHSLYWERVGTPGAKPAVFLHGGPGGGMSPDHRRQWDPARYDVLLFDQRGCGKSTPFAEIEYNDTWRIDQVRLGALSSIPTNTRGTFFLDAFESRRETYIGP